MLKKDLIEENKNLLQQLDLYKSVINDLKHIILNNQMDYREFVDIVNAIEENARKSE